MADQALPDFTALTVAPAATDLLYIGDLSEPVLDDQNKKIEIQILFDYLGSGNFTSDIILDATGTLNLQNGTVQLNEAVDLTATSTQLNNIAGLSGGDFTSYQHDHSDAANGGQLTSPLVNEAVALTATATELNQLDGVSVGGTSAGDIVTINGTQTLTNKTLTSPNVNEAVALSATATELNQLDGVSVGGTSTGDIVTIDDTQTLTGKTLTTPTIGDFTNATHDHSNAANGGTLPVTKTVELEIYDAATTQATGTNLVGFTADANINGLDLTNVLVACFSQGASGTTDVQVVRRRSGTNADMLSTVVTLANTEWFAQDGVIDTANDDVQTGDVILIDVDAVQGTPGAGLFVTLEFS